jgi:methionyl aminopeptidase
MIHYKTPDEIKTMQQGGAILKEVMQEVVLQVKPGITTMEIDQLVQKGLKKRGADISFNKVDNYSWATCTSVNAQIVHTPPSSYVLKDGDLLTIDAGAYFGGFHTDYAISFMVGDSRDETIERFLQAGKDALTDAIKAVKVGNYIGDISKAFQDRIESEGYSIIRRLTGHGVGKELHEEPYVPCFVSKPREQTVKITPGLVIAVEVMYAMGSGEMIQEPGNDWSLITKDGSLSAQFEHSLAVSDKNTLILT